MFAFVSLVFASSTPPTGPPVDTPYGTLHASTARALCHADQVVLGTVTAIQPSHWRSYETSSGRRHSELLTTVEVTTDFYIVGKGPKVIPFGIPGGSDPVTGARRARDAPPRLVNPEGPVGTRYILAFNISAGTMTHAKGDTVALGGLEVPESSTLSEAEVMAAVPELRRKYCQP